MRENRPYGSEGGESGSTGLPYPYSKTALRAVIPLTPPAPSPPAKALEGRGGQAVFIQRRDFGKIDGTIRPRRHFV